MGESVTRERIIVNRANFRHHRGHMNVSTPISLFDYDLPPECIAQHSVAPRDHSKLLLLNRQTGERRHRLFFEIIEELHTGDVLVLNQTKVFKARLYGRVRDHEVEVFLLKGNGQEWQSLLKPGRHVRVGDHILFNDLEAIVKEKTKDGRVILRFPFGVQEIITYSQTHGEIPIPPYVKETPETLEHYQTVYAKEVGSVAAPTAGFHFTESLLKQIQEKGVQIEYVTLHVGIGTFRPIKTQTIEEHEMHAEFVQIEKEVAQRIHQAKQEGRRIIAVGTTSVRCLEGVTQKCGGTLCSEGFSGEINLFITPGYTFQMVDALITNFHLPKSSLLVLVSAFAGREAVLTAYQEAIEKGYRFYSFGDAMFFY